MSGNFLKRTFLLCASLWLVLLSFAGCEYSSDGPLKPSSSKYESDGEGYFLSADLDSGSNIHLASDTLYLGMQKIWSFSNCALKSIDLDYQKEDSILWIAPTIAYHATEEDCPAPIYRPDTVLKVLLDDEALDGIGQINVKNDKDSTLDSILLRRGSFELDTFNVYVDSSFSDPKSLPLKTKVKRHGMHTGSILKVLDSLTPRVFYWRTMKSACTNRVDMCDEVVPDTVYPTSWSISDTNLVPVHYACADTNLTYCINGKWKDDSTALGKLQERPDTIWNSSTYYVEEVPECATFDGFNYVNVAVGYTARFIRRMFVPDEDETFCGPSTTETMMIFKLPGGMVMDNDSVKVVDDLLKAWKKAEVAPDTLITED